MAKKVIQRKTGKLVSAKRARGNRSLGGGKFGGG